MENIISHKKKICVISLFIGKWPGWFPFFLNSCKINSDIDFILFSDASPLKNLPGNIRFYNLSLINFNALATKKLKISIDVKVPYKICDFKPAFGKIFSDYLIAYDFWGYCDIDLVFGRIGNFINPLMLEEYDIISMYKGFLSGPFCLYRNKVQINNLYMRCGDYIEILKSSECKGFDESIQRPDLEGFSLHKLLFFMVFFLKNAVSDNISVFNSKEIRYQFQWNYKRFMLREKEPRDMTEVIWQEMKKGRLKASFGERVFSDSFFLRNRKRSWRLEWSSKGLFNQISGKELLAFHFRESKTNENFEVDSSKIRSNFIVTQKGIF